MKATDARVLLTGASGGIGQAMVKALRQAGAQVMGVGRGVSGPSGMTWHRADLNDASGPASVAQAAADWRANVVVHASGVPGFGALTSISPQQMEQVLQANLLAPMRLAQALLPQLLRQPCAQMVFVGSALGRIGVPGFSVYGASKAGLRGFAEALRRELADTKLRVQILGPRSTRTGFNGAAVESLQPGHRHGDGHARDRGHCTAGADRERGRRSLRRLPERLGVRLNGLLGAGMDASFAKHRRSLPATPIQTPTPGTIT